MNDQAIILKDAQMASTTLLNKKPIAKKNSSGIDTSTTSILLATNLSFSATPKTRGNSINERNRNVMIKKKWYTRFIVIAVLSMLIINQVFSTIIYLCVSRG